MGLEDGRRASHESDWVVHAIQDVLRDMNVNVTDVLTVTADQGSNLVSAFRQLKLGTYIPCACHVLHRAVVKVIEDSAVAHVITAGRSVSRLFHVSQQAQFKFRSILQASGITGSGAIPKDNVTRWTSTYDMISKLLQFRSSLQEYGRVHMGNVDWPYKDSEWQELEDLAKVLNPIMCATLLLEGKGM